MLLCVLNLLLSTSLFFATNMETLDMQRMALEAREEFVVRERDRNKCLSKHMTTREGVVPSKRW